MSGQSARANRAGGDGGGMGGEDVRVEVKVRRPNRQSACLAIGVEVAEVAGPSRKLLSSFAHASLVLQAKFA